MRGERTLPTASEAAVSLRRITSNIYETWRRGTEMLVVSEAVARNSGLLDICDGPPDWSEESPYYNSQAVYPKS